jgi:hypothetical protein
MTEENKDIMMLIITTASGILATWLGKDKIVEAWNTKVTGRVAEKKADSEIKIAEKDSAIAAFERAIKTLQELVEVKKEEAHDCHTKLKEMGERMSVLENAVELYRKRVIELEKLNGIS